ncbi:hypothetical protein NLM31_36715 [Bradyrhizobium sp. CCGUVB4N]|uniref:hypothetical protein n=1 Tax=Bradyrhizobium sp. CCGUVB4N TaxID=2949631 RepID=UPI0020B41717|nr:hypothetical protein [Bradyrhizobium sp. CCGUVB4N]MCP3385945.1 hypothetical protein [Bradyrhizobium sp. CCGUVB4N]
MKLVIALAVSCIGFAISLPTARADEAAVAAAQASMEQGCEQMVAKLPFRVTHEAVETICTEAARRTVEKIRGGMSPDAASQEAGTYLVTELRRIACKPGKPQEGCNN